MPLNEIIHEHPGDHEYNLSLAGVVFPDNPSVTKATPVRPVIMSSQRVASSRVSQAGLPQAELPHNTT